MAASGEGQDRSRMSVESFCEAKRFKRRPYRSLWLPKDDPALENRLSLLYKLSTLSLGHGKTSWWVACCSTLIRHHDGASFKHPQDKMMTMKEFFHLFAITSEDKFKQEMLARLPNDEKGLVQCPEVNMDHEDCQELKIKEEPISQQDVKMEEEALEEARLKDSNVELLQSILAKQQEQDAKLNEMLQKMNDFSLEQQKLAMKVKLLQGEVEALFKTDDEREMQHSKTRDQMEALKTAFNNIRLQMNEIDFKVTVLVDDCKVNKPSLSRQIAAGLQSFSRFDKRPQ